MFVIVFHQMKDYVALPLCPESGFPSSNALNIVDMLSNEEAVGLNLDKTELAATNFGAWKSEMPITRIVTDGQKKGEDE